MTPRLRRAPAAACALAAFLAGGVLWPIELGSDAERAAASTARPRTAMNASAAATSGVAAIGPGGSAGLSLTGAGVLVGQWDEAGVRTSHRDLRGRASVRDASGVSDHATHVAGTIAGDGSGQVLARGMAPSARLWSFGYELDLLEMREYAPYLALSNHAYGFVMGWAENPACDDRASFMGGEGEREDPRFGKYGTEAAALDALIHETGLLTVWAGGNERQDGGAAPGEAHYHFPDCSTVFTDAHDAELALQYDTLGLQLAAKNGLVVGAIGHVAAYPAEPEEIVPLAFSSFGPMDDGRIKPDLVASGELVFSTVSGADDAYQSFSGTSSSAAVVSGGLALLSEHHRALHDGADPPPELWKALLVHAARPASPDGAPSYATGYGLFDARAAAALLTADAALDEDARQLRLDAVSGDEVVEFESEPSAADEPLRFALAWIDPPGVPNAEGIDDPTPALVNDLDLIAVSPEDAEHHAWSLDPAAPDEPATRRRPNRADNVEVVDVTAADNPDGGRFRVRVALSGPAHRLRPQPFALVSSIPLSRSASPRLGAPRRVFAEVAADGTSPPLALTLRGVHGGELAWTARSEVPWLALESESGETPAVLSVAVDTSALEGAGPHLGWVVVDAGDASGPHAIGIVVEVACAADCTGRVCGPEPACGRSCGECAAGQACDPAGQCAALATASCPSADLGSRLAPLLVSAGVVGSGDDVEASCGDGGQEHAFRWTAPVAGHYRVSARGRALDGALYARDACDGDELACTGAQAHGAALTLALETGQEIVAFVDPQADSAGFALGVQRALCPDVELGGALGAYLADDTTQHLGARLHGSCGGSGEEALFGWTAPAAGSYRFEAHGAALSPVLHVRDGSCDGAELGCSEEGTLELELERGQHVIVAVDGDAASGRFALGIASADGACVGRCDGTPNRGDCYCDAACVELGDCCADACASCGHCCVPACDDKECGDDGCGGRCGECAAGEICDGALCRADACAVLDDGAGCDDGDACTEEDRCIGGRCGGTPIACDGASCVDGRCPSNSSPDAGSPSTNDAGEADASAHDDAGTVDGTPANDGCGCTVPGATRGFSALPAALTLVVSFAVARRRRRALAG